MNHDHIHTPECFQSHLGAWAMRTDYLTAAVSAIRAGTLPVLLDTEAARERAPSAFETVGSDDQVAVVPIVGPMQKGVSKYGGCSTINARRALRAAARDKSVQAIYMPVDSPGGHVAGTHELSEDIRKISAEKPVWVQIEDGSASAAVWSTAHASRIVANEPAMVGSIGVYGVVYDESQAAEMEGVKVHVVSTGGVKGGGVPGTPITDDYLAELEQEIAFYNDMFLSAVAAGRGLSSAQMEALNTGQVWPSRVAQSLELVDAVQSSDETLSELLESLRPQASSLSVARAREREASI